MKALKQTCLVIVYGCFMLMGVGCGDSRQPSGKYVSGNTITISRNGVVLNELLYDGKQLVDPQTAKVRGPYVRQK